MSNKLAIRGGLVADGTGTQPVAAEVAIEDGRIVEVGATVRGDEEIDASGCIVAPGFIDIHTHYDAQILWDPACTSSSWQGVTTAVLGNCGFSLAPCPASRRDLVIKMLHDLEDMSESALRAGITWSFETFAEYLDAVAGLQPWINLAAYVGHSTVRISVMGEQAWERPATADEIDQMRATVRDALAAGATGFATSASPTGRPVPSRFADPEETYALVDELRRAGHGVGSFVPGGAFSHEYMYEFQPRVGRPFTWTALLTTDDGRHRKLAALHASAYAMGAQVHPQVSCRPLVAQTTMRAPFSLRGQWLTELDGSPDDNRIASYRDRSWRDRSLAQMGASLAPPNWARWRVVESAAEPALVGRAVAEVAQERGCRPWDVVLDTAIADRLDTRFEVVLANDAIDEVTDMLQLDGVVLGLSDAGAHPDQICDSVLPTDLLGQWVRDRGALDLGTAIHKLTGEPADIYGFAERGHLRPGAAADIVVFDPDTVGPGPVRRVHDLPDGSDRLVADQPTGLRHIMVNGSFNRRDEATIARESGAGRVLRSRAGSGG